LVFNANKSIGDWHYVPLALKFAASENGVCLRIDSLVELTGAGTAYAGVITCVSVELPEYEAVEARVIRGRLKPKRAACTSQADFDRLRCLNF
jgi:1-aminocyclopropane-1-carboxylate deaminase/D-cysteine desulfhydrase-like pyridoxal-dependent ACC family enzyme